MREQGDVTRYLQAAALLPPHLRRQAEGLDKSSQAVAEELRLRAGRPMSVVCPTGERPLPGGEPVSPADLSLVVEIATRASAHTAMERMRSGFFTVPGGHRIGICGSAVVKDGAVFNLRQLSSLAIRIAREVPGAAAAVADRLWEGDRFQSTLILSPPGGGKTTLLRDLIRRLSDGTGHPPLRVGVADERGELAASWEGIPQNDLGPCCDVLTGWPKAQGMLAGIRALSPQVVICDEIGGGEEAQAVAQCLGCGVQVVAAIHGESLEELWTRPQSRRLLATGAFSKGVLLAGKGRPGEILTIKDVTNDETSGNRHDRGLHGGPWPAAGLPDVRPCG